MITYDWGNHEDTLMVVYFVGRWDLDEFRYASNEIVQLAQCRDEPIVILIDLRRSSGAPTGIMPIAFQYGRTYPKNIQRVIIISRTIIWEKLWDTIETIFGKTNFPIHFVKEVDMAYQLASEYVEV